MDVQVLNGTGSNGQMLGLLNVSGISTVAYTDSTPTLPELYPFVAQAKNKVETTRFLPAEAIVMHPRRWNWILSILDSGSRPFVASSAGGVNVLAVSANATAEGSAGTMLTLPVYIDANVPTTLTNGAGSSGTEDVIILARSAT